MVDVAVVGVGKALDDVEAESGATGGGGVAVRAGEALEQAVSELGWDAEPVVLHMDVHAGLLGVAGDADGGSIAAVLAGVGEQVDQDLL